MKKIVFTFGLISGAIVSSMFMITMPLYKNGTLNMGNGEIIGYSSMVISLSMIFFGVKSYRDRHLGGVITFGNALKVGLLIAGIAALFYAVSWEIYFNNFYPDFMDRYAEMCVTKAKSDGASEAELLTVMERVNTAREIYKNPALRFGMTIMEILPVGIIISLISAAILRKRQIKNI